MPAFFLSHGGGPCFFMNEPSVPFKHMGPNSSVADWYRKFHENFMPRKPSSIVIFSAHWEEADIKVTSSDKTKLLFDYYGFPDYTYQLKYPCPGSPALAENIISLLNSNGIKSSAERERGLDHGVFVPLLLMYPEADIPVVQVSLNQNLDPALHIRIGEVLEPLRNDDVLFLGSGFATHNLNEISSAAGLDGPPLKWVSDWDQWLGARVAGDNWSFVDMKAALTNWKKGPNAVRAHPREEHLVPLFVAAGFSHGSFEKPIKVMSEVWGALDFASFQFN